MPELRIVRPLAAVAVGLALGVVELAFVVLIWPWSVLPPARPAVRRVAARLMAWELARHGGRGPLPAPDYRLLAARGLLGTIGGYVAGSGLFVSCLLLFGGGWALLTGGSDDVPLRFPGVYLVTGSGILGLTSGFTLLALVAVWIHVVGLADGWLTDRMLGPGERERLRRRVAELTETRSGVVRAIDDERRRIERDLHDGVQQRGVALAMLLGRARHSMGEPRSRGPADTAAGEERACEPRSRGPASTAAALVEQAYAESRLLLDEVRNVAWRIYPTALDELGLHTALAGVAERSVVPVTVHGRLTERPVSQVETALYFVAREAIANAVKHARASDIVVVLTEDERTVSVAVSDDGIGGADPGGGGLGGLARRVRALDGTFTVDSPPGGPTRVVATIPKAVPCD